MANCAAQGGVPNRGNPQNKGQSASRGQVPKGSYTSGGWKRAYRRKKARKTKAAEHLDNNKIRKREEQVIGGIILYEVVKEIRVRGNNFETRLKKEEVRREKVFGR